MRYFIYCADICGDDFECVVKCTELIQRIQKYVTNNEIDEDGENVVSHTQH